MLKYEMILYNEIILLNMKLNLLVGGGKLLS